MNGWIERYYRTKAFLLTDLWKIQVRTLDPRRALLIRALRVLVLIGRGLAEDRWQLRASALTYYTLLSIVPFLAMAFGVAKGFGLEEPLSKVLYERLKGQEEVVGRVVDFSNALLKNVQGGLMAVIGLVVVYYAVFRLLSQIEAALNDVWGVDRPRPWGRKVVDYLAVMLICPLVLIMSSTMTVFIAGNLPLLVQKVALLGAASPAIFFLLKFMPFFAVWVIFTFMYLFLPNTRIAYGSGVSAGIFAGTFFQVFQGVYIQLQISLSNYNAIYGSFAALPLFILWLQLSWSIVLFGAEVSSALERMDSHEYDPDRLSFSHAFRLRVALGVLHRIIRAFDRGDKPTAADLAKQLDLPATLVNRLVTWLVKAGLVSEVVRTPGVSAYQPARDPDHLTLHEARERLERQGPDDWSLGDLGPFQIIHEGLETMAQSALESDGNRKLKEL
jgi:membrane protein